MKWSLVIVAAVMALTLASAVYLRSLDPRPANMAMQASFAEALSELKTEMAKGNEQERAADSYLAFAQKAATIALLYVEDPDLRSYARHVLDRPRPKLQRHVPLPELASLNAGLLGALDKAVLHVGTPDDRFFEIMLPLERATAELGRLADITVPASPFRTADPGTLMAASAAAALRAWGNGAGHSH